MLFLTNTVYEDFLQATNYNKKIELRFSKKIYGYRW